MINTNGKITEMCLARKKEIRIHNRGSQYISNLHRQRNDTWAKQLHTEILRLFLFYSSICIKFNTHILKSKTNIVLKSVMMVIKKFGILWWVKERVAPNKFFAITFQIDFVPFKYIYNLLKQNKCWIKFGDLKAKIGRKGSEYLNCLM